MAECPICLDEIKKKATLECKHQMCSVCIIKWLNEDHSCPICRSVVDVKSEHFRLILNKLSMHELKTVISNLKNEVYVDINRPNRVFVREYQPRQYRGNERFICINTEANSNEENLEIIRMVIALLLTVIVFIVIFLLL